jgi:DNA-binding response OmpR family regulator
MRTLLCILSTKGHRAPRRNAAKHASATILVADDEPTILFVVAAILNRSGYKVLTAPDGNEALKTFENAEDPIHLVLSDFFMPGMDGAQFVRLVQERSPSTAVLLMSAALSAVPECGVTAIAKPFTRKILVAKVRRLLAGCDFAQIEREQSSARAQLPSVPGGSRLPGRQSARPAAERCQSALVRRAGPKACQIGKAGQLSQALIETDGLFY